MPTPLDLRIPRIKIEAGADDITPYVTGFTIRHPIEEVGAPLIWTGEIEINRLLADTLPADYFDNEINQARWAAGNTPIKIYFNNQLWQIVRVSQSGFSFDEITENVRIRFTDLLGLLDNYQPPQLYRGIVVGGQQRWTQVVRALLLAAGERVGITLNIDPVPDNGNQDIFETPRNSVDNFVREAQLIAGERGVWMWCDKEVIKWAVYPNTGQPFDAKSRYELLKYDRLDGLDKYYTRFLVDGTGERIARCPANEYPKFKYVYGGVRSFSRQIIRNTQSSNQFSQNYNQSSQNRNLLIAYIDKVIREDRIDTSGADNFVFVSTNFNLRPSTLAQNIIPSGASFTMQTTTNALSAGGQRIVIQGKRSRDTNPQFIGASGYSNVANASLNPEIRTPPVPLFPQQGYIRFITTERGSGANAIPEGYVFKGRTDYEVYNKTQILYRNILLRQAIITQYYDALGRLEQRWELVLEPIAANDIARKFAVNAAELAQPYIKQYVVTNYEYSDIGVISKIVKTVEELRFFEDIDTQPFTSIQIGNNPVQRRRTPYASSRFVVSSHEITTYERQCRNSYRVTILRYGLTPPIDDQRSSFERKSNPFGYISLLGAEVFDTPSAPEPEYRPAPYPIERYPLRQLVNLNFTASSPFIQTEGYYQMQTLLTDEGVRRLAEFLGRLSYQRTFGRLIAYGYDVQGVFNYRPFQLIDAGKGRYVRSNWSFTASTTERQAVQEFRGNLLNFRTEVPAPPAPIILPPSVPNALLAINSIPNYLFEVGQYVIIPLSARGGTGSYSFSFTPSITGLSISGDRIVGYIGLVSPTTITVTVDDGVNTDSTNFVLASQKSTVIDYLASISEVLIDLLISVEVISTVGLPQPSTPSDLVILPEQSQIVTLNLILETSGLEIPNYSPSTINLVLETQVRNLNRDIDLYILKEQSALADIIFLVDTE